MSKKLYKAKCDCTGVVNGRNQHIPEDKVVFLTDEELKTCEKHMVPLDPKAAKEAALKKRIRSVVKSLDKDNPDLWTKDGKPRMEVIEKELGDKGISREDVESALEDFNPDATTLSEMAQKKPQLPGQ